MKQKRLLLYLLLLALALPAHAQRKTDASGGRQGETRKDKSSADGNTFAIPGYRSGRAPLNITGTFGTATTSSWGNSDFRTAPFSMIAFGNLTFNIYEWKIPVLVNMSNIGMSQFSFSSPTFKVAVTPTCRNLKLHFGHSSMNVSKYTYSNLTFLGAGMEYSNNWFRAAGFYGTLQRATRYEFVDNRNAIQHLADSLIGLNFSRSYMPVFRRDAVAGRIGFGSSKNYADLSFFRAKDDLNSLPDTWVFSNDTTGTEYRRDKLVQAKENLTIGLTLRLQPWKWMTLAANGGASLYTADQNVSIITPGLLDTLGVEQSDVAKYADLYPTISQFYTPRLNTTIRFAGDASLGLRFKPFSANFTYRFVQPNYITLGANSFSQNVKSIGGNLSTRMFHNRSTLGVAAYLQRNNLDGTQKSTNQVGSYSLNWVNSITNNLSVTLNYNAVKQDQFDGTAEIKEEKRVNQLAHTVVVTPAYTFYGFNDHTLSLNLNYLQNMNLNEKMQESMNNVINTTTLTGGAGYELYLRHQHLRLSANYDYSLSSSLYNSYTAHAVTLGGSYQLLQRKDYVVSLNGNLTVSYNIAVDTSHSDIAVDPIEDLGTGKMIDMFRTDVISASGRLGGSFAYKQWHNLSLYLSVSNYSDNVIIGQHIATDLDFRLNLNYTYAFAKRAIKRKEIDIY